MNYFSDRNFPQNILNLKISFVIHDQILELKLKIFNLKNLKIY